MPLQDPGAAPAEDLSFAGELRRKALHLLALVVPFGMLLLGRDASLLILVPGALVAVAADVLRARSHGFARFIESVFGSMMRREEIPPVGGPVVINGATWVLVTAALLALVFPLWIGVPAFVMFMIADAAAALVGRRFGRRRWPGTARTVEGTLAFFAVGLAVIMAFPGLTLWVAAASVAVGALAEAAPRPLNDNIRVPVVSALVIFALERWVLGTDVSLFL